jgi:hypothetical protein
VLKTKRSAKPPTIRIRCSIAVTSGLPKIILAMVSEL